MNCIRFRYRYHDYACESHVHHVLRYHHRCNFVAPDHYDNGHGHFDHDGVRGGDDVLHDDVRCDDDDLHDDVHGCDHVHAVHLHDSAHGHLRLDFFCQSKSVIKKIFVFVLFRNTHLLIYRIAYLLTKT